MVTITVSLVAIGTSQSENVAVEIPTEEWAQLLEFHQEVERLRATPFVQNRRGGQIAINWHVDRGISSKAREIDTAEVDAMLLRIRPFVLAKERCHFYRISRMLGRRLVHSAFRKQLSLLSDSFSLKAMQRRVRIKGPARQPLSIEVVMDWLNSHQYHRDAEKKEHVAKDLGLFGQDRDGLPFVLFALVDMVQAILDLDSFVETLILVERGELTEIKCPPDFLSG